MTISRAQKSANRVLGNTPLITAVILALVIGTTFYSIEGTSAAPGTAPAVPAIPVTVQTLKEQKARVWSEFSGRLQAVDSAEIRPEVSGRITKVLFEDGQNVKAGDVLFVIDPRPYEAAVAKAEADVASAKTNATFAKLEQDRAGRMIGAQAIAQRIFDERSNSNRVAGATLKAAEAELKQASIDLEHAYVRAPIAGRTSRVEITLGNLVQAGSGAPLLTRIVSNQNIYADFEVDEQTYLQTVRDAGAGRDRERQIPVNLSLQNDSDHVYHGHIYSFDNRLDATSGTIRARAKFSNADGTLVPGMFVSVALANGADHDELLIPDQAVSFDQSKKFVYVVGSDNKVAYREIELGKQVGPQRVALKGVKVGDRVIVDGVQRVIPNAVVEAKEASTGDSAAALSVTN